MTDELPILDELERRLIAGCYGSAPGASRVRSPRRWTWFAAAGSALVAVAVAALVIVLASGTAPPPAAAQVLDRAALAAAQAGSPSIAPGEYWYTRTLWDMTVPQPIVPKVYPANGPTPPTHTVLFTERSSNETWIGTDGTERLRVVPLSRRPADAAAARRWKAADEPMPSESTYDSITAGDDWFPPENGGVPGDLGDGLFSYAQLVALPTSVPALQAAIAHAQAAYNRRQARGLAQKLYVPKGAAVGTMHVLGHNQPLSAREQATWQELFTITQLLQLPLTADVRATLYRVAASLPGVRYDGSARDALGRTGVAVSVGPPSRELKVIFDPSSGELLATIQSIAGEGRFGVNGLVQTVQAQGVAGSISSLPAGVEPVGRGTSAPQLVAIAPTVGRRGTTFTLTTTGNPFGAMLTGPTAPNCRAYLFPPPQITLHSVGGRHTAGTGGSGGTAGRRYRISPASIGRREWCAGRYQLQLQSNTNAAAIFFDVR